MSFFEAENLGVEPIIIVAVADIAKIALLEGTEREI